MQEKDLRLGVLIPMEIKMDEQRVSMMALLKDDEMELKIVREHLNVRVLV